MPGPTDHTEKPLRENPRGKKKQELKGRFKDATTTAQKLDIIAEAVGLI